MMKRYDLRADVTQLTSDPAMEGTLRSRCVPRVTTPGNTKFTDQCLKEDEDCDTDQQCHVTVGDCPTRGDSTKKAPRWSHSGHNYKVGDLVKYHTNRKEGTAKCLKVILEEKKDKKEHFKAVPYLVPCPERDVDFGDEFKWYLEPRIGTFVSNANGMCLTLKSMTKTKSIFRTSQLGRVYVSKKTTETRSKDDQVALRPCNREFTPISQGWDLYASSHRHYDDPNIATCKHKLPTSVSVFTIPDFVDWIQEKFEGLGTALTQTADSVFGVSESATMKDSLLQFNTGIQGLESQVKNGTTKDSLLQFNTGIHESQVRNGRLRRTLLMVDGKERLDGIDSGTGNDPDGADLSTEDQIQSKDDTTSGASFFTKWIAPIMKPLIDAMKVAVEKQVNTVKKLIPGDVTKLIPSDVTNLNTDPNIGGQADKLKDQMSGAISDKTNMLKKQMSEQTDKLKNMVDPSAIINNQVAIAKGAIGKIIKGGSYTQGVVYGLPLNNGFYKFKSKDGYNCNKLPLAAHSNQRYGIIALEAPKLDLNIGPIKLQMKCKLYLFFEHFSKVKIEFFDSGSSCCDLFH